MEKYKKHHHLNLMYQSYLFHLPPLMNPMFLMRLFHPQHPMFPKNQSCHLYHYYLKFLMNLMFLMPQSYLMLHSFLTSRLYQNYPMFPTHHLTLKYP